MVNQELLDYIKSATASGQSREAITQSLLQNGWEDRDVQEGLTAILGQTYSPPENKESVANTSQQQKEINNANTGYPQDNIQPQKASPRSILPMAIIAGTAVIVVGIAATFWFLIRGNALPTNQLAGEQTVPVKATSTKNIDGLVQEGTTRLVATSSIATSSKSMTQNSSVVDCVGDMACFIQKAKKCEPAAVKLEATGGFFSVKVITREILGLTVSSSATSEKCQFSIKQGKTDVVFPPGTSSENITQGTKQQTAFDGMIGSCNTSTAILVDVLNKRMLNGGFSVVAGDCDLISGTCQRSIGGLETAQCSGNYFKYKFNPQTGEVVKE